MLLLIPICLLVIGDVGLAAPGSISTLGGTGYSSVLEDSAEANLIGVGASKYGVGCLPGEVPHIDGTCVAPHVTRSIYVYAAPKVNVKYIPPPPIPKPRINYNVVFVRTPETLHGFEPIVIPPPQEKTIVYVLTKNGQLGQHVIEVPAAYNHSPEVYYVNYNEGENPVLPGGIHLQEALATAATHDGHLIGGPGIVSEDLGAGLVKDIDSGFSDGVGDDGGLIGGVGLGGGYAVGDVAGGGFGGGFGGGIEGGFGGGGVIDGFGGGSLAVHSGGHEGSFGGGYSASAHSSIIRGISGNKIQSGLGGFLNSKGIRPINKPSKLNVKFR